MSLVVFQGGRLYADTKAWGGSSSLPSPGCKNKVVYANDGAMLGITTAVVGEGADVLAAYNAGKDQVDGGSFVALVVKPGVAGYFYWIDERHLAGPFDEPHFAVGSGAKYALGALDAGASISEVFRIAAAREPFTDSTFRTFDLADAPKKRRKRS